MLKLKFDFVEWIELTRKRENGRLMGTR